MKFVVHILFLLSAVLASHSGISKYNRQSGRNRFEIEAQSVGAAYNRNALFKGSGGGEGGLISGAIGGTPSHSGNHTYAFGGGGSIGGYIDIAGSDYAGDIPRYILRGGTSRTRKQSLKTTKTGNAANNSSAAYNASVANNASALIKDNNGTDNVRDTSISGPSTTYGDGNFNSIDITGNHKGVVPRNSSSTARNQTLGQLGITKSESAAHYSSPSNNASAVYSASALIKGGTGAVGSPISGFAAGTSSSIPITTNSADANFNSIGFAGNYDGDVRQNELNGISGNFKQNLNQRGTIQTENALIKVSVGVGVDVYTNGRSRTDYLKRS